MGSSKLKLSAAVLGAIFALSTTAAYAIPAGPLPLPTGKKAAFIPAGPLPLPTGKKTAFIPAGPLPLPTGKKVTA